ncbi:MAG: YfiR family protein [Burkholderiaceae bacterium]
MALLMRRLRQSRRILLLAAILGAAPACRAAIIDVQYRAESLEYDVEAAYLYKFGSYVTWPEGTFATPDSPIVIGIAAADAVADALSRMVVGRNIGGRPLQVRRMGHGDAVSRVHILFVGADGNRDADGWLAQARGLPVLCVTREESGQPSGSVVNFVVEGNRVRFDVSLEAAERNHLRLGAPLLSVARKVTRSGA